MFNEDFGEDQGRWHWLREQAEAGEFRNAQHLRETINPNMKLCSVCYGPPKDGRADLILCECESVYWCSEECKKKVWELHTLDHRQRHTVDVVRVCLECGKKGGSDMPRCGRCQNCFFCSKDCQKYCWSSSHPKPHKKECKKYERGGRGEWSNVV